MHSTEPPLNRPTLREKHRRERNQDLKAMAFISLGFIVAGFVFFPFARDIWAAYLALVGAILVITCAIRLSEVLGFVGLMGPAYRATSWEGRFGSGWIWTTFMFFVGIALIIAAAELSVHLKPLFFGLDEFFRNGF